MIELKNLNKTYHNKTGDFKALKNINLKLDNTGMVFIFGESGNGKSTLLNIISGLDTSYEGDVLINEKALKTFSAKEIDVYRRDYIGFIFEEYNLINHLSVKENIKIATSLKDSGTTDEDISKILNILKLEGMENRMPNELSGGQKQRVSIARTIFEKPSILFVDEPTGHLDYENTNLIWEVLKEISKTCLVIAVSHEKRIVDNYADRVIKLKNGVVTSDKTKKESKAVSIKENETNSKKNMENLVSGKLKFKNEIKLSWGNLRVKPVRTAMAILLPLISLMLFSVFFLLQSFNVFNALSKNFFDQNQSYAIFDSTAPVNSSMVNLVSGNLSDNHFKVRNANLKINFTSAILYSDFENFKIEKVVEMPSGITNNKNALGQKVLFGKYPTNTTSKDIVVSDFIATLIMKYGAYAKNGEQEFVVKNKNFEELVNTQIVINNTYFNVSGIYETNFKDYLNDDLKLTDKTKLAEFNYNLNNYYGLIHVNNMFLNSINAETKSVNNVNVALNVQIAENDFNKVSNNFNLSSQISSVTTAGKSEIGNLEINLPYTLYNYLFEQNISETLENFNLNTNYSNFVNVNINNVDSIKFTIVGINNSSNTIIFNSNNFSSDILYSQVQFDSIIKSSLHTCGSLVVGVEDENKLANNIKNLKSLGLSFNSFKTSEIENYAQDLKNFENIFLGISIVSSMFTIVLMITMFMQLIEDRRRDMGVLVAMGASKFDLVQIFMYSTIMLAAISFALAALGEWILMLILNAANHGTLGFNLFAANGMSFVWLFVISFGVAILSLIPSAIKIFRKSPVDLIKK